MNWDLIVPITLAAVSSGILIIAEHYFPWRLLLGRKLPHIAAYTLGMLAVLLPFTLLVVLRKESCIAWWQPVIELWVIVFAAGAADAGCYALDQTLEYRARALDAEEREAQFRSEVGMSNDVSTQA